jgi:hypothetical protein
MKLKNMLIPIFISLACAGVSVNTRCADSPTSSRLLDKTFERDLAKWESSTELDKSQRLNTQPELTSAEIIGYFIQNKPTASATPIVIGKVETPNPFFVCLYNDNGSEFISPEERYTLMTLRYDAEGKPELSKNNLTSLAINRTRTDNGLELIYYDARVDYFTYEYVIGKDKSTYYVRENPPVRSTDQEYVDPQWNSYPIEIYELIKSDQKFNQDMIDANEYMEKFLRKK